MFGKYSNQRISKAENKILKGDPDDYNWYCIYARTVFNDGRFFQIREDIDLPQDEDDNGVVLMFQGGDIVYFKTLDGDVDDEAAESVYNVCSYLAETFNRPIDAYVVFPPDCEVNIGEIEGKARVTMYFTKLGNDDGEEIIDRLETKLRNNKKFTYSDSIDHMLLRYSGFKDKAVFEKKFKRYMALVEECGSE